jgi:Zn-dependent peptidase ImmA (M78 family)
MGVTIWSADAINGVPADDLAQLVTDGADEWSGFTIRGGAKHLIVVNPSQSIRRKNSVIMHELAHIMLGHDLADATVASTGELLPSTYDANQEDEAAWLGATLLLPRPALLWMRYRRLADEEAADHFGVSRHLLQWRIRMTGVDYQLGHQSG